MRYSFVKGFHVAAEIASTRRQSDRPLLVTNAYILLTMTARIEVRIVFLPDPTSELTNEVSELYPSRE